MTDSVGDMISQYKTKNFGGTANVARIIPWYEACWYLSNELLPVPEPPKESVRKNVIGYIEHSEASIE